MTRDVIWINLMFYKKASVDEIEIKLLEHRTEADANTIESSLKQGTVPIKMHQSVCNSWTDLEF